MKTKTFVALLFLSAGPTLALGPGPRTESGDIRRYGLDRLDIDDRLAFADPSAPRRLVVDNVFGSIDVIGYDGDEIRLKATAEIRADSRADHARALEEVFLRVDRDDGEIRLIVDGPFRRDDGSIRWNDDYRVSYDFEIEVPRETALDLTTINEGHIDVRGVRGEIEACNVNGSIELENIGGAGSARTVNGEVEVTFAARPTGDWKFATVNGDLDVEFPPDLSADLSFKTFNGEVYTDFDYELRQLEPLIERHRDHYRVESRGFGARIADGGPELAFETLNGDILVRNRNR